jgi:hypothetical protein
LPAGGAFWVLLDLRLKVPLGMGGHSPSKKFCYNQTMNCPTCKKPMKKVSWSLSNNGKKGTDYKEYDRTIYQCVEDDAWVTTELPATTS